MQADSVQDGSGVIGRHWLRLGIFLGAGLLVLLCLLWCLLWQVLPRYAPFFVMEHSVFAEPMLHASVSAYGSLEVEDVDERFGEGASNPYLAQFLMHADRAVRDEAVEHIVERIVDDPWTIDALYQSFERYQDHDVLAAIFLMRHKTSAYIEAQVLGAVDKELIIDAFSYFDRRHFLPDDDNSSIDEKAALITGYDLRYLELNFKTFLAMPASLLSDADWSIDLDILTLAQYAEIHDYKNAHLVVKRYAPELWKHIRTNDDVENYWGLCLSLFRFDQEFLLQAIVEDPDFCTWLSNDLLEFFENLRGEPAATDALIQLLELRLYEKDNEFDPVNYVDALKIVYAYRRNATLDDEALLALCQGWGAYMSEDVAILLVDHCLPFSFAFFWELRAQPDLGGTLLRVFDTDAWSAIQAEQRTAFIKQLPAFAWRLHAVPSEGIVERGTAVALLDKLDERGVIRLGAEELKRLFAALEKGYEMEMVEALHSILARQQQDISFVSPLIRAAMIAAPALGDQAQLRSLLVYINQRSTRATENEQQ